MLTKGGKLIRNAVEEAIYVVFNGPTLAAIEMRCAAGNFHYLLKRGMVMHRDTAVAIEAATERVGCKVPATELMALVPWQGPERHPGLRATSEADAVDAIGSTRRNATAAVDAVAHARQRAPQRAAKQGRKYPWDARRNRVVALPFPAPAEIDSPLPHAA